MQQLLQQFSTHLLAKQDQLITFDGLEFQCEGWFKAEFLTFLRMNYDKGAFDREVKVNGKQVDIEIRLEQQLHRIELKHWRIGKQKQDIWTANRYFGLKEGGIYEDVNGLSNIDDGVRWILIFVSKKPTIEDWRRGIDTFNTKFAPLRVESVVAPIEGPDYFSWGLLKV